MGKRRQPRTKAQRRAAAERRAAARQRCQRCRSGVARAAARGEAPALHWCDEHRPTGQGLQRAVEAWEAEQRRTDRAVGRLVAYSGIGWAHDAAMRICASLAPIMEHRATIKAARAEMDEAEQFADAFERMKRKIAQEWAAEGTRIVWKDHGSMEVLDTIPIEPQVPGWVRSQTEPQRWDLGHTAISVARIPGDARYARTFEIRVYTPQGKYTDPVGRHYERVPCSPYLPAARIKLQVTRWAKRHGFHATGWRVRRSDKSAATPEGPAAKVKATNHEQSRSDPRAKGSRHR